MDIMYLDDGQMKALCTRTVSVLKESTFYKFMHFLRSLKSLLQDEIFNASYWRSMENMTCTLKINDRFLHLENTIHLFFSLSLEVGYEKKLVEGREIIYAVFL